MPDFNPHSPDCKVGLTELDAARWVQRQVGMVQTTLPKGRIQLFKQGQLRVEGQGVLGAVVAAQKVLA